MERVVMPWGSCGLPARDRLLRGGRHRVGRDAELRIELAGGGGGAEAAHADEGAVIAEPTRPRAFDCRLDADTRDLPEHLCAVRDRLPCKQFEAGCRDHGGAKAALAELRR